MTVFELRTGQSPLVVSIPHDGREVPPEVSHRMSEAARALPDTDWHVARLHDFLDDLDATVITARYSRYVVDLNRGPDQAALYPGRFETGLVPVVTFAGEAIYEDDPPSRAEIEARTRRYWKPYHDGLEAELERVGSRHGYALLWDAHSIRRIVPSLFEDRLPDLSIGTNDQRACHPSLEEAVHAAARQSSRYSVVLNGRFRGGYITRHYGRPSQGVHAVQLELVQATYMNEAAPYEFREDLAKHVRPLIQEMMAAYVRAGSRL